VAWFAAHPGREYRWRAARRGEGEAEGTTHMLVRQIRPGYSLGFGLVARGTPPDTDAALAQIFAKVVAHPHQAAAWAYALATAEEAEEQGDQP
jgi:hypothetical protein